MQQTHTKQQKTHLLSILHPSPQVPADANLLFSQDKVQHLPNVPPLNN